MTTPHLAIEAYLIWQEAEKPLLAAQANWFQWHWHLAKENIARITLVHSSAQAIAQIKRLQAHDFEITVIVETMASQIVGKLLEAIPQEIANFHFLGHARHASEVAYLLSTPDEAMTTHWSTLCQAPMVAAQCPKIAPDLSFWHAYGHAWGKWLAQLAPQDQAALMPRRDFSADEFSARPDALHCFDLRAFPGAWLQLAPNDTLVAEGAWSTLPPLRLPGLRTDQPSATFSRRWCAHFASQATLWQQGLQWGVQYWAGKRIPLLGANWHGLDKLQSTLVPVGLAAKEHENELQHALQTTKTQVVACALTPLDNNQLKMTLHWLVPMPTNAPQVQAIFRDQTLAAETVTWFIWETKTGLSALRFQDNSLLTAITEMPYSATDTVVWLAWQAQENKLFVSFLNTAEGGVKALVRATGE